MPRAHPILFTPENVRAILDGRKTQTRRLNGLKKFNEQPDRWRLEGNTFAFDGGFDYVPLPKCPYGQPGDRLWVRETWAIGLSTGNSWHSEDDRIKSIAEPQRYSRRYAADGTQGFWGKWRPSIFMPRWACRLWLELTEVRVERLQECSEEDAIAEGVTVGRIVGSEEFSISAVAAYQELWGSINGEDSWAANPWVWVLTFRKVSNG